MCSGSLSSLINVSFVRNLPMNELRENSHTLNFLVITLFVNNEQQQQKHVLTKLIDGKTVVKTVADRGGNHRMLHCDGFALSQWAVQKVHVRSCWLTFATLITTQPARMLFVSRRACRHPSLLVYFLADSLTWRFIELTPSCVRPFCDPDPVFFMPDA